MSDSEHTSQLKRKPSGILKLDTLKNRSLSGTSIDYKPSTVLGDEFSPPSSVSPQLSVTWAFQLNESKTDGSQGEHIGISNVGICGEDNSIVMKSPDYHSSSRRNSKIDIHESDDEDYSASLNAIIQRKASVKKKRGSRGHRRMSSPASQIMGTIDGDRRRSSVYTTSSGETAITLDDAKDDSTQDKIFENIRLHKEVLQSVKLEPWSMKRKLRLVKQAKSYITRHEGALQEHFTSRTAKSLLTQFNIYLATKWRQLLRELTNLSTYLIPWESRIKEIESHFGSVVASYFIFLRWLFWVNIVISLLLVVFVMMPEEVYVDSDKVKCDIRKTMSPQEQEISSNFSTIWEFEGRLKYSALFYGYYSTFSGAIAWGYNLPLAYFLTGLVVYIYSFVATLKKMAKNSRMSKLSSKDDEYVFSWKLFTGWDYMIGHTETSQNRMASIILGFKEALLEEAEKKKDTRNWRIILLRITVNFTILGLLILSAYAVVTVVKRSIVIKETDSWWTRNEITVVMSLITFFFPMIFEALGLLEYYHPRKQLRIQLARIMVLNLLNLYSLILALFDKITHMTEELREMKPTNFTFDNQCYISNGNYSYSEYSGPAIAASMESINKPFTLPLIQDYFSNFTNNCVKVTINCTNPVPISTAMLTTLFLSNLSTTFIPELTKFNLSEIDVDYFTKPYSSNDDNESYTISYEASTHYPEFSTNKQVKDEFDFSYDEEDVSYYLEQRMRSLPNDQFDGIPINKREVNISSMYEQLNWTIDPTIQPTEPQKFFDMVTQAIQSTMSTENSDFQTMTYTELYTYVTGKYDDFLESYYYAEEEENGEDAKCYEWICNNDIISTTQAMIYDNVTTERTTIPQVVYIPEKTTQVSQISDITKSHKISRDSKFKNADIRTLCWETMFGQELAKLTIMDLLVTIFSTMILDFLRALFVRYMNNCWCWDLEKIYPKYGDFKIAENILHLVNNQGMVWMGMFFSPGLAVLNIFKLIIIMYLRSWTVLTCNVPHEVVFRASRSNNFYFALLLTMLFLCVLPVSYAIVFLEPSWHCGPFSQSNRIYHLLTNSTEKIVPEAFTKYIVSPAAIIPLLVLLILIIYYLVSLTGSLREANQDLKIQLRKERTEERRKMFKIATNQHCQQSEGVNGLSNSWNKVLDSTQLRIHSTTSENSENDNSAYKHRELLQRMMKKTLQQEQNLENDKPVNKIESTTCKENVFFPPNNQAGFKHDINSVSFVREGDQSSKLVTALKTTHNVEYPRNHIPSKTRNKHKTSDWVEKIPVITISKTSSEECVIDSDVDDPNDNSSVFN